jgi:hypothetical protein
VASFNWLGPMWVGAVHSAQRRFLDCRRKPIADALSIERRFPCHLRHTSFQYLTQEFPSSSGLRHNGLFDSVKGQELEYRASAMFPGFRSRRHTIQCRSFFKVNGRGLKEGLARASRDACRHSSSIDCEVMMKILLKISVARGCPKHRT